MKVLMALAVVSMVLLAVIPAHAALDDKQAAEEFKLYLPQAQGVITVTESESSAFDRR